MKRAWAMKWARDLEAPRRKQAMGVLKEGNAYCCLGRLCVVAGLKPHAKHYFDGEQFALPKSVQDLVGMRSETGDLPNLGGNYNHLASLNDDGVSFKEIAKIIRKHWREL